MMSDENYTTVEGVLVTAQRRTSPDMRWPMQVMPIAPLASGELSKSTTSDDTSFDNCASPIARREWEKDAAAAEARSKFRALAAASGETLSIREYGAYLYYDTSGKVQVGPIAVGDPVRNGVIPSVKIPWLVGVPYGRYAGEIHSHPTGYEHPSPADRSAWAATVQLITPEHPVRGATYRLYIVAAGSIPQYAPPSTSRGPDPIYTYDERNIGSGVVGPEVNPSAARCA